MTALNLCGGNATSNGDAHDQQLMADCPKCGQRNDRVAEKCDVDIYPVVVCPKCDYCSIDNDSAETDDNDCRGSKSVHCRKCVVNNCKSMSDNDCKEHDDVTECDDSTECDKSTDESSVTFVGKCKDCGRPVENLPDKVCGDDGEQPEVKCLECDENAQNAAASGWSTKCDECGNSNKKWFHKIVSDDDIQLICLACLKTWIPDSTINLQGLPEVQVTVKAGKVPVVSQETSKRIHRRVKDLSQLRCGDHVAWDREYVVWHHAIITDVDVAANQITVIHNSGGIKDMPNGRIASVRVETFSVDCEFELLYVFEYDETECFAPEEVIERATQRLDDRYDPFTNNCEHFARWCKTGLKYSLQRKSFDDRLKMGASGFAKVIEESLMTAVRFFGKSESMQDILGISSKNAAAIIEARLGCFTAPSTIVHGLQIGTFFMGLMLAILAEIIFFSCKLYESKKDADAKYMPVDVFQRGVFQLLTEGLVGLCGGLGAAFGMSLVPYAGPFLSPIGYVLGNWLGRIIGALIGRLSVVRILHRCKRPPCVAKLKSVQYFGKN